jgi:hypothetical protein
MNTTCVLKSSEEIEMQNQNSQNIVDEKWMLRKPRKLSGIAFETLK